MLLAAVLVVVAVTAKWVIGRLAFALSGGRLALLALSPVAYLFAIPLIAFLIHALSGPLEDVFYDGTGNSRQVVGINAIFLALLIAAVGSMSLVDGLLVRQPTNGQAAIFPNVRKVRSRLRLIPGWLTIVFVNFLLWLFWVLVWHSFDYRVD